MNFLAKASLKDTPPWHETEGVAFTFDHANPAARKIDGLSIDAVDAAVRLPIGKTSPQIGLDAGRGLVTLFGCLRSEYDSTARATG